MGYTPLSMHDPSWRKRAGQMESRGAFIKAAEPLGLAPEKITVAVFVMRVKNADVNKPEISFLALKSRQETLEVFWFEAPRGEDPRALSAEALRQELGLQAKGVLHLDGNISHIDGWGQKPVAVCQAFVDSSPFIKDEYAWISLNEWKKRADKVTSKLIKKYEGPMASHWSCVMPNSRKRKNGELYVPAAVDFSGSPTPGV